jgi:peptide/nickel transport system substrate-binding protein
MRVFRSSVVGLVLVACAERAQNADGGEAGGTIIIPTPGGIATPAFPPFAQDPMGRLVSDALFDRLAEVGPDLNTVGDRGFTPRLARGWEWSADSLSIAFALDPRARWHDGRPVTAHDVRYSFGLYKNPKTSAVQLSLLGDIDSVSVRDSLTAVAWFRRRTPEQFYSFTYNVFPMPEHVLRGIAPEALLTSAAIGAPVGNGRFRAGRVEPGVRFELVADTANYRGRPKLDRVVITTVADPGVALTQLMSGEADFVETVPPPALSRVDSAPTLKLVPYPGQQHVYLGFNFKDSRNPARPHPLFADLRVRQAIAMGLDRQAMLQNVFGGRGVIGTGPAARALGDTTIRLPPFDRARAAALLDSAGWRAGANGMRSKGGQPLAFKLAVPTSSAPRMQYAVLIQEQLRELGIRVDLDQMDFNAFMDRGTRGLYDVALHGRAADPGLTDMNQSWASGAVPPAGQNWIRYSNPAVDAIADSLTRTSDPDRVRALRRRAYQTITDDAAGVWLYDVLTIAGAHERVRTAAMRADAWWSGLADWWIPANERIERDRIGLRAPAASDSSR